MASAILSSARHGAYIAIGFYLALVLVVSAGAEYQRSVETSLHAAVSHDRQVPAVATVQGAVKGVTGA